jgi:hypothetical protein
MNMFFLFLLVFFGILGVIKTINLTYTFMVQKISSVIFKKEENIKIWTKP